MQRSRTLAGLVLAAAALLAAPSRALTQDAAPPVPLAPPAVAERLTAAAVALGGKGRGAEAESIADVLAELRVPGKDVDALRTAIRKALLKAKPGTGPLPDVAASIAGAASDLAAALATTEGDAKRAVARQTLRLDATQPAARAALGEVEFEGGWAPKSAVPALQRRRAVRDAIRRAKALEIDVRETASPLPAVNRLFGGDGEAATYAGYTLHAGGFTARQCARQLREALRALALASWVQTGKLEVPKARQPLDIVFVRTKEEFVKAVQLAAAANEIPASVVARYSQWNTFYTPGYAVTQVTTESEIAVNSVCALWSDTFFRRVVGGVPQPAIQVGMCSFLCWNVLGRPAWTWVGAPGDSPAEADNPTSDSPAAAAERAAVKRLSRAGPFGTRRWLTWLAQRNQAPAWSRSMTDNESRIVGADALKCLSCVEYLIETDDFPRVVKSTLNAAREPASFKSELGGSLEAFEVRWRDWLLAGTTTPGLAQTAALVPAPPGRDASGLARLDALRATAIAQCPPAPLDDELSQACRAHARYLVAHPERQKTWPDVHDEDLETPDYTAEGCRAGQSSVIVPGVASADAAIDAWMGTFYHRLPLLHPGVARVGWALEGGVAVLDAVTLAVPPEEPAWVVWPPRGAKAVPRKFVPEMPDPVPGEDQSNWGYPITLQTWEVAGVDAITMRLVAGTKRDAAAVPCHFSSPTTPTNPDLAPVGAFCLIPRQPLAPNTTYTVVIDGSPEKRIGDWTFTTGK